MGLPCHKSCYLFVHKRFGQALGVLTQLYGIITDQYQATVFLVLAQYQGPPHLKLIANMVETSANIISFRVCLKPNGLSCQTLPPTETMQYLPVRRLISYQVTFLTAFPFILVIL